MLSEKKKVLVTGAAGFVGSHCVLQVLNQGFQVRAAVRNPADTNKIQFLNNLTTKGQTIEFVKGDLLDPSCWDDAIKGCAYVLHVASPNMPNMKDENLYIKPAVEGTLNVLEAALRNGVQRIVITSSVAACWFGNWDKRVDENDWSNEIFCDPYAKSKLFAEKAVWDFHKKHGDKIDIVTILPSLVTGPVLTNGGGYSEKAIGDFLNNKVPALIKVSFGCVDVRDVAKAHVNALKMDDARGKRFILSAETLWMSEVANVLREEFGKYGYKITKFTIGKCLLKLFSCCDTNAAMALHMLGKNMNFDVSAGKKLLGQEFLDIRKSLKDMGYSLIEKGGVVDKINASSKKQR